MSTFVRLTTAQAIVRFLQAQHSEFDGRRERLIGGLWGIWGHGNVASMSQAIEEFGTDLPFHHPKNEQSMVHVAMGYAKAKNRMATLACSASIGPGSTNMLTGAAAATVNRIPVLLLPSDIFAHRKPGNVLQQLEHPVSADVSVNDAFRPLSRFFDRISRPEQLLSSLPQAVRVLLDPADTGAVTISIPQDVQGEGFDCPEEFFRERVWTVRRRSPDAADIAQAIDLLRSAKTPFIIAGGGVRYSAAETTLVDFANEFGIVVGETHAGKGTARGAELLLGGHGLTGTGATAEVAAEADVVVCIGTRLSDFVTASRSAFRNPDVKFIGINVGAMDAHKLAALPVVADAKLAIEALHKSLSALGYQTSANYRKRAKDARARWQTKYSGDILHRQGQPLNQGTIVRLVNEAAAAGDVVIAAAGTPPGELHKAWDNGRGSEVFLEFGFSCMGHEIPAGLGVRLARPEAGEIFVVIGDGTYLMQPTELVTAAQDRLKITVVLIENSGYQCIRDLQEFTTGLDNFGNEFRRRGKGERQPGGEYLAIDYAANARSMGCEVIETDTSDGLSHALAEARKSSMPTVIVVHAEKRGRSVGAGHWWDVGVAAETHSPLTEKAAKTFSAGKSNQRTFA